MDEKQLQAICFVGFLGKRYINPFKIAVIHFSYYF